MRALLDVNVLIALLDAGHIRSNWGQIPINLKLYAQSARSLDCGGLAAACVCGRGLT